MEGKAIGMGKETKAVIASGRAWPGRVVGGLAGGEGRKRFEPDAVGRMKKDEKRPWVKWWRRRGEGLVGVATRSR